MAFRIQLRRDLLNNWAVNNPVLLEGELGYVTDNNLIKIGDGTTPWNDLPYWNGGGGTGGFYGASVYYNGIEEVTGATGINFYGSGISGITGSNGFANIGITGGGGSPINTYFSDSPVGVGVTGLNFTGSAVTAVTDSSGYTTIDITNSGSSGTSGSGAPGPTGPTGPSGSPVLYNTVSRYQTYLFGDIECWIVSSSTVFTGFNWSRSGTVLTINSPSHGLSDGDGIVVRNANEDNFWGTVTVADTNTIEVNTNNTGATSGSSAAYSLAFTTPSPNSASLSINSPSIGDCQLLSVLYATGARSGSTLSVTVPTSATNGAGANTTSQNSYFPIIRVHTIVSGAIQPASMTLNTSYNFNVFNISSMNPSNNSLVRLDF